LHPFDSGTNPRICPALSVNALPVLSRWLVNIL
jgi:hypothetical protein